VTADPGTRGELHEAERLRRRHVDHRPDVDAELVTVDGELVHQRDVDVPEGVLQQLGQLGLARARRGHHPLDDIAVEGRDRGPRGVVHPGDDLRCVPQTPDRVGRVDPLRAVAEVEVGPRAQARPSLQDRREDLLGGSGVGRRLQHDAGTSGQVRPEHARSVLDVVQVGEAVAQRGRHADHRGPEAREIAGVVARGEPARPQRSGQVGVADVVDEALAASQPVDPALVHVEPDDVVADLDGTDRERQPDVALADHDHPAVAGTRHGGLLTFSRSSGRARPRPAR
jgi:hypothetical protein